MYIFLILFFLSLAGIIFMLGKKLILIKKGNITENNTDNFYIKIPNLHEVRYITIKKSKKYGFIALVIIIRFSVLSTHLAKKAFRKSKNKVEEITKKYIFKKKKDEEIKEVSKFLKMVSDYKKKVKKIKSKIKEEEGIE